MGKRLAAVGARHESSGKESKAVKKSIKAGFKNARSNPIGDNNIDPEDAMIVALFFAPPLQVQPRFMRISQRSSAGKILDAVSKHVPDLPAHKGGRYYLYSVKRGGGVNLLPHITPLRDVRMLIGEAFVVGMDDGGLDAHVVAQVGGALGVTSGASASSSLRKKKWLSRGRSSEGKDRCAVS